MKKFLSIGLGVVIAVGASVAAIAADKPSKSVTGNLEDAYCYGSMGAFGAPRAGRPRRGPLPALDWVRAS